MTLHVRVVFRLWSHHRNPPEEHAFKNMNKSNVATSINQARPILQKWSYMILLICKLGFYVGTKAHRWKGGRMGHNNRFISIIVFS